jgi:bifunctional non-homologous end joining protein LigD
MLSDLFGENDIGLPIICSEHLTGDGQEMFEHAAKLNFEGHCFQKGECTVSIGAHRSVAENQNRSEGPIPGHRICEGSNGRCTAVLRKENTWSTYLGKVGTGWSRTVSSQIRKLA